MFCEEVFPPPLFWSCAKPIHKWYCPSSLDSQYATPLYLQELDGSSDILHNYGDILLHHPTSSERLNNNLLFRQSILPLRLHMLLAVECTELYMLLACVCAQKT